MEDAWNLQFLSDFILAACVIYTAVRLFVFVCDAVREAERVVKDSLRHQPFEDEDDEEGDEEDEEFWFEQQFEEIAENNTDLKHEGQKLIEQYQREGSQ